MFDAQGRLETEYREPYAAWKASPSPVTAGALVRKLQPTLDAGVSRYVGSSASPVIRSRAKQIALEALDTYDPQQSRLSTHVINHLQGLRRVARQERQILSIPERLQLDAGYLQTAQTALEDQLGRAPSTAELADYSGLSLKRIGRIRSLKNAVPEGAFAREDHELPSVQFDRSRVLLDAIYAESQPPDQRIIEWTLGLYGQPKLSNQQIAAKLGITPGAVSQRKAKLQQKFNALYGTRVL